MKTLYEMLSSSSWGRQLSQSELDHVCDETTERYVRANAYVARVGQPAEHWIGVIDGLLKMSVSSPDGRMTTLAGLGSGAWFGEGSVLKREPRRYDVVTMRPSRLAMVPHSAFMRLRERSLAFNHYLQGLMNARLGWFIGLLEYDRLLSADARVARCLAGLFNPDLYPEPGAFIDLTQNEIGLLSGTSRQRTNAALQGLQREGLLRVEGRGVTVVDLEGLRSFAGVLAGEPQDEEPVS